MTDGSLPANSEERNEDYTGSVCWLIWNKRQGRFHARQALIDAADFKQIKHLPWRMCRVGKKRHWRIIGHVDGKEISVARLLKGDPPGMIVDHENRNPLDDRRLNLRVCTVGQNNSNNAGYPRRSQYKGVQWKEDRNKWIVLAGQRGKPRFYGVFDTEIEAAQAYNEFAKKTYGPYAYLNPV
jgi:hypothetical protein